MDRAPLSSPRPSPAAAGCLIAFFSVFALIGAVSFYAATVRPALALLATRSWRQLPPNLLVGLVPLVFFAIGVAGIAWVLHGGARPKLAASPAFGAVDPQAGRGGSIELRPQMTRVGALIFLAFFCVFWNGIVSVFVWQAVQNSHTDRRTFAVIPVVDTDQEAAIPAGAAAVAVPAGTVPTFNGGSNRIVWSLKVTCDIPGWPDSEDEYEVLVRPGAGAGA